MMAGSIQGKMIISINDHDDIRDVFQDFAIREVGIHYTVGGAQRGKGKKELIITNF